MVMDMSDLDSNKGQQQEVQFSMTENAEYQKEQIQEIKLGREQGLDISLYANPEFNWMQMEQIARVLRIRWMFPYMPIPLIVMRL